MLRIHYQNKSAMKAEITDFITSTATQEWKPLVETGIDTCGIFVKPLRYNEEQKRFSSILLKFQSGAKYPYHNHPGGEELFVLKGECIINDQMLRAGDYLYTPAGFKHAVRSDKGCELLFIIPEEVQVL